MRIIIKSTQIDLTPSIKEYIEQKIGSLDRLLAPFEKEGQIEVKVEIGRTTHHHHKGDVFRAETNMRLPGKMIRAEKIAMDARTAVDRMRNTLRLELAKYRALHLVRRVFQKN